MADKEIFLEKLLMEPNEEAMFRSKFALDGGSKKNILLDEEPSVTFHLLKFFLHEIPGTIFTAELLPTLSLLLPPPGILIDASGAEKIRQELSKLSLSNFESLKLLAWYYMQLEQEANYSQGEYFAKLFF